MTHKISLFSLVLLIVSGIASVRTLPTTAFFGTSLLFYYLLATVFFLIPVALISAEFSSRYPEEGGIFHWIRKAFGESFGLLAVWLQWVNTMIWYPTMLLFISGTAAYLIDPALAQNKLFLLICSLFTFWGLTLVNLRGIQVSVRLNSFCGIAGTLIPMILLIALGALYLFYYPPNFSFPSNLRDVSDASALVTVTASFLGMELAGVHISEIINPAKNFPKAIAYSVFILLFTLVLGAFSVATVIPSEQIHFVDGIMQTFSAFFSIFHLEFLLAPLALFIILGATGGSVNWLLSPAKGLLHSASYGFLPQSLLKTNQHGVASRILILQACVVSLICLLLQWISSENIYYWFLMALSTGLYMLMYVLLFLSALKLKRPSNAYQIPRGMRTFSCIAGLLSCVLTIFVSFQLPPNGEISSYGLLIAGGFFIALAPVLLLRIYRKKVIVRQKPIEEF